MKKLLFLFLAISISFLSCNKDDDDFDTNNIIGSWEASRVEVNGVYEEIASAVTIVFLPEYTFNVGGTGSEKNIGGTFEFTWTLTEAKVLTISNDTYVEIFDLEELTSSKFVYKEIDDDDDEITYTYTKK